MSKTFHALILAGTSCGAIGSASMVATAQGRTAEKPPVTTTVPSLNFYGTPGVIDLPSAEALPDGQLAVGVSHFGGITRTNLTFQFSPRISATFRYVGLQDFNSGGFETFRDRSFDFRYQLVKEGRYKPAVTVGLQDFSGTGIYAAEYLVATKNFSRPLRLPGKVKVTGGLGWGRLGSQGSIGSPFGVDRPAFDPNDTGGEPSTDSFFRGPVSPFAGFEWQVNDRLGLKAEYSSDAYDLETSLGIFSRNSSFNVGAEYQVTQRLRVGGYYLYGSEIGINAQYQLNPKNPIATFRLAGPRPIIVRPDRSTNPAAYATDWTASESAPLQVRDAIEPELRDDGIRLESITVSATRAEARVSSIRYDNQAIVVGRTARSMARIMPPSVETFDIVLVNNGLALSKVTVARRDLETLEFQPNASELLLSKATIGDAEPRATSAAVAPEDVYPRFSYSVGPFLRPSFFDPDEPLRAEGGVAAEARFRFAPGWLLSGEVRHRLAGNIEDSTRLSDSVLPRVRTDAILFAQGGDTTLENLFVSKQWKPSKNTYARVSTGYLEQMFGGVSAELLWKPTQNRLALGVETNYVKQRDFDQRFGFQDYQVATGHVSAYYDFGKGYFGQLDAGRYLAGDYGATFTMERQFANGWRVGGFFTLTNVSSADFGEGSFDKGISLSVPISWFTGRPSKQTVSTTIRPVQRDGGQRLNVSDRLYEQVRDGHLTDLTNDFGRVWQ
ncbi:MAG: YjbH domain-containing protein [Tateyamaria sp.]|uniref:YjbH domain-containing protein n=1 Tax=Tateyamaria sp. TaxID=1929288 RepID=UPI00329AD502